MLFSLESCSKSYLPITWLFQAPNSHQSISFKIHSNSTAFPTSRWRSSKSVWTTRPVLISSKCAYKHNRTRQYWCKYPAVFECRKFKCVYFSAVFWITNWGIWFCQLFCKLNFLSLSKLMSVCVSLCPLSPTPSLNILS